MAESDNNEVISRLKLFNDEPSYKSELFNFKNISEQLILTVSDESLPTPFCIGIDGEWGSGKTSLIKKVFTQLHNEEQVKEGIIKIVWFDAWAYERLDPIYSLMYTIANEFGEKGRDFKKYVKKLTPAANIAPTIVGSAFGIPVPPINIAKIIQDFQMKKEENQPYFTITQKLVEMIGNDRRLIIFVDDLDRCSVNNVLDIFEGIKVFLNAPKTVFVVAADMKKLEKIWLEKYGSKYSLLEDGREQIEKIFQLRISLPAKQSVHIEQYIKDALKLDVSQFNNLLIKGCPPNPRKIKRILNLVYFKTRGINDKENFHDFFELVILWSIMTTTYPEMARLIEIDPRTLFRVSILVYYYDHYGNLITGKKAVEEIDLDHMYGNISPTQLQISTEINLSFKRLRGLDMEALKLVIKDPNLFSFLKFVSEHYSVPKYTHTSTDVELDQNYLSHAELLKQVITM